MDKAGAYTNAGKTRHNAGRYNQKSLSAIHPTYVYIRSKSSQVAAGVYTAYFAIVRPSSIATVYPKGNACYLPCPIQLFQSGCLHPFTATGLIRRIKFVIAKVFHMLSK
jgi:hypothetical protein